MVTKNVATPSDAYSKQLTKWALPRALMGGTCKMREASTKYLPKEPGETDALYQIRLQRSTLFNAFRKTVNDMTGKVFADEIVLGDDVPASIKEWADNIDNAGRDLNTFGRDVFVDAMQIGLSYILVDMPPKQTEGDRPPSVAEEKATNTRPYLVHIQAENLIGWKSAVINGQETLTQIRIKEQVAVDGGGYDEKIVDQIRVLEPGKWETWQKSENSQSADEWVKVAEGTTTLTAIALAPVYLNRTAFMLADPPLEDLADLNVAHWQSQSDQRNILHVARVPILYGAGFSDDAPITIGANSMVRNSDATATLSFVEHSGAAIGAGAEDLKALEAQMQTQGLQLMMPAVQGGGKTATGEMHDSSKENSQLAMMALALGRALQQAFTYAAQYAALGDKGGTVTVNTDFGVFMLGGLDLTELGNANRAGKLSDETYWNELKRRDILAETFDPAAERERIQSEPPPLGMTGPGMDLGGAAAGGGGAAAGGGGAAAGGGGAGKRPRTTGL